jgi:hypothetical protein
VTVALQVVELSDTTDSAGYLNFTFDNPITQVMVTANSPASGFGSGVVSATAVRTGSKTCKVRVHIMNNTPDDWSVRPAINEAVVVTLMGISQ